jgi:hypothetical protein
MTDQKFNWELALIFRFKFWVLNLKIEHCWPI